MQNTNIFEIVTIQALELQIKKIFTNANKSKTNITNGSFSKINKPSATDTNSNKKENNWERLKQNVECIDRNIYTKYR